MGSTNSVQSVQAVFGENGVRNGRETVCTVCDCANKCGLPLIRYVDDNTICEEQTILARVTLEQPESFANLLASMPESIVNSFRKDGLTPAEGLAGLMYEIATERPPSVLDMLGSLMLDDNVSPEAAMVHMVVRGDAGLLAVLGINPAALDMETGTNEAAEAPSELAQILGQFMDAEPGSPEEDAAFTALAHAIGLGEKVAQEAPTNVEDESDL